MSVVQSPFHFRAIMMNWIVLFLTVAITMIGSPALADLLVDDLPDLTGGVVPVVQYKYLDPFSDADILTSVSEVVYEVRIKNNTGNPLIADSVILVVDSILEISGKEISHRLKIEGIDGRTKEGKPYFRIPSGEKEIPPYGESQPVTLRVSNPDFLRFFPPIVRVRGIQRTPEMAMKDLVESLVQKGLLSPEEAKRALESPSSDSP
jgi:hypothetical protein